MQFFPARRRYWVAQLLGWGLLHALLGLQSVQAVLTGQETLARVLLLSPLTWLVCVGGSHLLYRWMEPAGGLTLPWLQRWRRVLPRLLAVSILMAVGFWLLQLLVDAMLPPPASRAPALARVLESWPLFLLNFSLVSAVLLLLWWSCVALLARLSVTAVGHGVTDDPVVAPTVNQSGSTTSAAGLAADSPVLVSDGKASRLITPCLIEYVRAEGNYVKLKGDGLDMLIRATLSHLEQRLAGARFFRVNRQTLVNLRKVKVVDEAVSGNYLLVLESGTEIEASRRQGRQLKQELSL